eukprot:GFUD01012397.1.p1 GENE.GFUD01012397.1~~GFUD01012397.1.p1  ORF type:complete len:537 (+),score=171.63 GFUD01012397.1:46-1656(+)
MDLELPCRDTDPVENTGMEAKAEPLAFTIDFGDGENIEEKTKKFERFAQRSSLRKVKSPRLDKNAGKDNVETEGANNEETKDGQRAKVPNREKSNLTRTDRSSQKSKEQNAYIRTVNGLERVDIRDKSKARADKKEVDEEVTSQTGTYTMEEEEELNQVSRDSLAMTSPQDKTKYVADWTAKHSLSPRQDTASPARRKLPADPANCSPDNVIDDADASLNDVQSVLAKSESDRKKSSTIVVQMQGSRNEVSKLNLRMGSTSSRSGSAPNSARSGSSESSGYQSRQDAGRLSIRRKPVSSSSLSKAPSKSTSSLTSNEAEFQAWKRRKEYKPSNSTARPAPAPTSIYSQRGSSPKPPSKQPLRMTQSLTMNELSMKRGNSFHQESPLCQENIDDDASEESDHVTYRTSSDYYLDEDELILPLFPPEHPVHSKPGRPSKSPHKLEALDSLVISTTHNVSSKLCQAAAKIIRKAAQLVPEEDEDQALTVETVTYLLEDTHMPSTYRSRTSTQLGGTLKNLKKLEQALVILNKVFDVDEE